MWKKRRRAMYNFLYPQWFFLLLVIPLLIWYDIYYFRKKTPKIYFSNLKLLKVIQKRNSIFKYLPIILKCLIILFITIALARPRHTLERREHTTYGVDIMLVIDISGSMLAVDFRPLNRMEVAKQVALDFINRRRDDRIGVVTFATFAHTLVPLTNDFNVLNKVVSGITIAPPGRDQTAIGNGIGIAVNRLKDSPAESKIIILLTDGANNAGQIDPIQAAEIARTFDIRVYAVGMGSHGLVDFPFVDAFGRRRYQQVHIEFCIDTLHRIAEIGGTGRAAMATSTQELQAIFDEIDRLEKTEITANVHFEHREMFIYFLYVAVALLFIKIMTRSLFRMSLP